MSAFKRVVRVGVENGKLEPQLMEAVSKTPEETLKGCFSYIYEYRLSKHLIERHKIERARDMFLRTLTVSKSDKEMTVDKILNLQHNTQTKSHNSTMQSLTNTRRKYIEVNERFGKVWRVVDSANSLIIATTPEQPQPKKMRKLSIQLDKEARAHEILQPPPADLQAKLLKPFYFEVRDQEMVLLAEYIADIYPNHI